MPGSIRPSASSRMHIPATGDSAVVCTRPAGRAGRRMRLAVALLIMAAAMTGPPTGAGELRVTLTVPMPEVIDMTGIKKVLVTRFIIDQEVPDFDLNREVVNGLRRELSSRTNLEILDVEPPPLPEQPLRDLISNTGFW